MMPPRRVALLLLFAFLFGGGSAEVALTTQRALARARAEREVGSAGQLVQMTLRSSDGEVLARPRLIAPPGKTATLVLRDPAFPSLIRLALKLDATPAADGDVALVYSLAIPPRELQTSGEVSLLPGVERAVLLQGDDLSATFFTLPVPSAA